MNHSLLAALAAPRRCLLGALIAALASSAPAFAAHPLISEDTGTQGKGGFELELGFESAKDGDARADEYGPQLSYGVLDNLDVIVRPAWLDVRGTAEGAVARKRGFGDTALDVKWRFADVDSASFATRAGISFATGDADRGLGGGKTSLHAVLIGQTTVEPATLIGNVGYAYDPVAGERASLWYVSASALWQAIGVLRLSTEAAASSPPQQSQSSWAAVARFGAIASVATWLDVDVGYQCRLNRAAPTRVLLAGATLRW